MLIKITSTIGRAIQLILSIVILDLAAAEIANQVYGSAPAAPQYADFASSFGILVAIVGVVAIYVPKLSPRIPLFMDFVLALVYVAGGVAWAVGLKGISCNNAANAAAMLQNDILNYGSYQNGQTTFYGVVSTGDTATDIFNKLSANCKSAFANEILCFVSFVWALVMVGADVVLIRQRNMGPAPGYNI